MTNKKTAPLYEALVRYADSGCSPWHTPGHKMGLGADSRLKNLITPLGLRGEVSLADELDDPFAPTGAIAAAQQAAAKCFGARDTVFSVSGTTGAIHMMILAALSPGDTVLVSRSVHRSVMGGLVLAGAVPVYIDPEYDEDAELALNITPEAVEAAVEKYPSAKALLLVSPNYYGIAANLRRIADILHRAGMLLLVDEAHGAHLSGLGKSNAKNDGAGTPLPAAQSGADLIAQSTHKLLGSLTQTSMLHIGAEAPADMTERVYRAYGITQTTSPDYLLLASLDTARAQFEEQGEKSLSRVCELACKLRQKVEALPGLSVYSLPENRQKDFTQDILKLSVDVSGLGITGPEAWSYLRENCLMQPELSDASRVLFIISYADGEDSLGRLYGALAALSEEYRNKGQKQGKKIPRLPKSPEGTPPMTPRDAYFAPAETVEIDRAVGRMAAEAPMFYPPGIPVFYPGEFITAEAVEYLQAGLAAGLVPHADDPTLKTIKVIKGQQ
ncbi:MAG: aminotransferase class I/II-fold pyridoxal phosphate-dependent enzyme [Selenomonadaceae bacterium]|nr:aminotransferase class I/II-fold pyridoxal phosphate-dependent enzyme [Selenomonadaceae bacterium]